MRVYYIMKASLLIYNIDSGIEQEASSSIKEETISAKPNPSYENVNVLTALAVIVAWIFPIGFEHTICFRGFFCFTSWFVGQPEPEHTLGSFTLLDSQAVGRVRIPMDTVFSLTQLAGITVKQ